MQKIIATFLLCFIFVFAFAQSTKKISTYLLTQFNTTLYDVTKGNNPWGIGLGLQTFLNTNTKFLPTVELTGDIYVADDKIFRVAVVGTDDVSGMVNLLIGTSFNPTRNFYVSAVIGPSFISGQTLFAIKPSLGFYFSKSQRWTGKLSYINVFNRGNAIREDFGSLSLALGVKLF